VCVCATRHNIQVHIHTPKYTDIKVNFSVYLRPRNPSPQNTFFQHFDFHYEIIVVESFFSLSLCSSCAGLVNKLFRAMNLFLIFRRGNFCLTILLMGWRGARHAHVCMMIWVNKIQFVLNSTKMS
jgi:hypothetical protein